MVINRATVLITLLYLSIIVICMGNAALHPFTVYIGDPGDNMQYMWYLGRFNHALIDHTYPWYSFSFNAPYGLNLMSNTSIMAESLLFTPFISVFGIVFSYNLLFASSSFLTLCLTKKILFTFHQNLALSVIGSIVFFLSPYLVSQNTGHPSITILAPLLGILLLILRIRTSKKWRYGSAIGVAILLTIQFYTSLELFVSGILVSLFYIISRYFIDYRKVKNDILLVINFYRQIMIIAIILLITCLPGTIFFFSGSNHGVYQLASNIFATDLANLVIPTKISIWHNSYTLSISSKFTGNVAEQDAFLSVGVLLLLLWQWLRNRKKRSTWVFILFLLIVTIFSFGPDLHMAGTVISSFMPWSIYGRLPILRDILPNRLFLYVDLAIILYLFSQFHGSWFQNHRTNQLFSIFTLLLVFVEWLPSFPLITTTFPTNLQKSINVHLLQQVKNEPVFMMGITPSQAMGIAASLDYRLHLVNFYGYANYADILNTTEFLPIHNQHTAALDWIDPLSTTHATKILLVNSSGQGQYKTLYQSLTFDLGKPTYVNRDLALFNVPAILPATVTFFSKTLRAIRRYHNDRHTWPISMEQLVQSQDVPTYYEQFTKYPMDVDMPIPVVTWQVINNQHLRFSVLGNVATLQFIATHWHIKKTQYQIHEITFTQDMYRMNQFLAGQPIDPTQNPYEGTFILTPKNR